MTIYIHGVSKAISTGDSSLPAISIGGAIITTIGEEFLYIGLSNIAEYGEIFSEGKAAFVDEGNLQFFTDKEMISINLPKNLQKMRLGCATGKYLGLKDSKGYAVLSADGKVIQHQTPSGRTRYIYYASNTLSIIQTQRGVDAIDAQGEVVWTRSYQVENGPWGIQLVHASDSESIIYLHYKEANLHQPEDSYSKLLAINIYSGDILKSYEIDSLILSWDFSADSEILMLADKVQVLYINSATAEVEKCSHLDALESCEQAIFSESVLSVLDGSGLIYVFDKTTLNHLHTIDLGQGQYHCHMTGNKTGVAVRLVDKNAFKGGGAGYGLYLTDEQLVKGEMPDLTPEPLAASVEKTPTEGGYNLTVTLNPELTVADFLRHLSHALWQTAYEHCTLVDAIDSTNVRLGPPDFMGTLTLNLKNAPELTDEQEQAINAIIEGAKRTMCGLGECIVQANTDDQRVLEIKIER